MNRISTAALALAALLPVCACAEELEPEPLANDSAQTGEVPFPTFTHPAGAAGVLRVTWEGVPFAGGAWIFPGQTYKMLLRVTLPKVQQRVVYEANRAGGAYEFTAAAENDHWGWAGDRCYLRGNSSAIGKVVPGWRYGNKTVGGERRTGTVGDSCKL